MENENIEEFNPGQVIAKIDKAAKDNATKPSPFLFVNKPGQEA